VQDRPTTLWTVQRLGKQVTCLARLAPHGIEIDIAHDGAVVVTRVFTTDTEALAWADDKRTTRTEQGWTDVAIARPEERTC
jgi:hypothetical protein